MTRPSASSTATESISVWCLASLTSLFRTSSTVFVRLAQAMHRGHHPAGLVGGVAEQPGQFPLRGGRHLGEQLRLLLLGQFAQRLGGLVGLHRRDQVGGLRGFHLPQQRGQLVRLHLLQCVRRQVLVQAGEQLLAPGPAQPLQHVGEFRGAQPA